MLAVLFSVLCLLCSMGLCCSPRVQSSDHGNGYGSRLMGCSTAVVVYRSFGSPLVRPAVTKDTLMRMGPVTRVCAVLRGDAGLVRASCSMSCVLFRLRVFMRMESTWIPGGKRVLSLRGGCCSISPSSRSLLHEHREER